MILTESNYDARIIPLDGRPHAPQTVRTWLGDSRGHWERNTLVVETTNFNDKSPGTNYQGSTDALKMTERFTLINPTTIKYEYTIEDPHTWTRPWSAEALVPRIPPPLFEFACHEQNYGLINVVTGAQQVDSFKSRGFPMLFRGRRRFLRADYIVPLHIHHQPRSTTMVKRSGKKVGRREDLLN